MDKLEEKDQISFGILILNFMLGGIFGNSLKIPEKFERLYEEYVDENVNIINEKEFIEKVKPIIYEYYKKLVK